MIGRNTDHPYCQSSSGHLLISNNTLINVIGKRIIFLQKMKLEDDLMMVMLVNLMSRLMPIIMIIMVIERIKMISKRGRGER